MSIVIRALSSALILFSVSSHSSGWPNWDPDSAVVPFVFTSDNLGNSVGIAAVSKGVLQPQMSVLAMGFYSDKNSHAEYGAIANYHAGGRWLLGADAYNGKYVDNDYFLGEQGNNNSSHLDVTNTTGEESAYHLSLRYILPWGEGEKGVSAGFVPNREITGSNPFDSGVSTIEVQPFLASRQLDVSYDEPEESWGLTFSYDWNNSNDNRNPTEGSQTRLELTYSPEHNDDAEWATVEFHNSHYWDLGALTDFFNKQVFAVNFYTADTPTWHDCDGSYCNRPPEYQSVKLGGLYRLRSFTSGRFHGRSAISYSAEYRVMPEWQPLGSWPIFSLYHVPWWQWVAFVDTGRVAEEYNLKTLHEEMKWSAGGAIRFQVEGVVVRTEMAWGSEDSLFRVMVNQPF